jgi:hypothetical protein
MDTIVARKTWATLEPYHAMIYFADEAFQRWEALGFPHRGMGYFASRSAAMGPVAAGTVVATFFNFNPAVVARFIPAAWQLASPGDILAARLAAADEALRRMLGDAINDPTIIAAAASARTAAEACGSHGRPLFAAHAELPWPEEPHLTLWHATTLLREFRGDGHVAALLSADLDPVEALVSYSATGGAPSPGFYKKSRGWSDEDFAAAADRLRNRGWLDGDELSDVGRAGRERLEAETDRMAMAPWLAIGEEAATELRAMVRPWSRTIVGGGGMGRVAR